MTNASIAFRELKVSRHARIGIVGDPERASEAWLVLHGYGMLARGILHWFRGAASHTRVLVAPEGLSRFYVNLSDAKRTVGASWVTREDLANELEDQFAYIEATVAQYIAPTLPLHVHGFSQGVSVGARWTVRTARPVARLVCWAGAMPDDVAAEDLTRALSPEPLHLVVGEHDRRVPPERIRADAARLRTAGLAVELHEFAGGHSIDEATLAGFASA